MLNNKLFFKKKRILIIGGTGFIGQNIIARFSGFGASITVLDKKMYGSKNGVKYTKGDVRVLSSVKKATRNKDIVINLAALKPLESLADPLQDLDITCRGSLNILEACKQINPKCKVIFLGSCLEYGKVQHLPVSEKNNQFLPDTFYGAHKFLVSHYARLYFKMYKINSTVLRFSNTYGLEIKTLGKMSTLNYFIKLALDDSSINIFGGGYQIRDYLYIDDALNAMEKAIISDKSAGEIFNIGSGDGTTLSDMVKTIIKVVGKGKAVKVPWPENYLIEPRNYIADFQKAKKFLKWEPKVTLEEGIKLTVDKFRKNEG